jgi:hypothetical protein
MEFENSGRNSAGICNLADTDTPIAIVIIKTMKSAPHGGMQ